MQKRSQGDRPISPATLASVLVARFNARAASVLCAFVMICSGIYMCMLGLSAAGSINVKAAVVEGKIETGSLGLLVIFLGVAIVLALNLAKPYAGQEIRMMVDGKEVVGKGLSYRKMRELVRAVSSASKANRFESSAEEKAEGPSARLAARSEQH